MIYKLPIDYNKQEYNKCYNIFLEIKNSIKIPDFKYKVILGGSCAKKTSTDYKELDIFIELDSENKFQEFTNKLFLQLSKFPNTFRYSKHKYITIFYKNKEIDIVPCISYSGKIIKDMDRSISHITYIQKNLRNKKYVTILKEILKKNNIYGAESYIAGVSGYTCQVIAVLQENKKVSNFLNYSQIPDPVDHNRNILACTSKKNIYKLNQVIYNLSNNNFRKLFFSNFLDNFKKGLKLLICKFENNLEQINKAIKRLQRDLKRLGLHFHFELILNYLFIESVYINYVYYQVRSGPDINLLDNLKKFSNKHACYWLNSGLNYDNLQSINLICELNKLGIHILTIIDYSNVLKYKSLIIPYYNQKYGPI
jgi:tRNA nucleotidyltransferase (CCA-adding enzyme)